MVFEVRIGVCVVRQAELNRQEGLSVREIPTLPGGVARWEGSGDHESAAAVNAFTFLRWCMRQYPDQVVTLVGSNGGDARLLGRAHEINDEAAAAAAAAELAARGDAEHDAAIVARENGRRRPPEQLVREMDRRISKGRARP